MTEHTPLPPELKSERDLTQQVFDRIELEQTENDELSSDGD